MSINKYTQNAEECFRMAASAKDQAEETAWLGLARSWLQLGRWSLKERSGGPGVVIPASGARTKAPDLVA